MTRAESREGGRAAARSRLTRQGVALAALGALIGLAGANTGANLFFLVLGLVCGTLLVSAAWGRRALRRLSLEVELPALVEAGSRTGARLRLAGPRVRSLVVVGGPFVPEPGLLLPDTEPVTSGVGSQPVTSGAGREPVAGKAPAEAGAGRRQAEAGAGRKDRRDRSDAPMRNAEFEAQAPERGRVLTLRLELVTRAPFHLVEHRSSRSVPVDVDVYPRLRPRAPIASPTTREGHQDTREPGQGGSLRNIRLYVPGDNPRHMDWRTSARTGKLQVRDFHGEARPRIAVVLETRAARGPAFEDAVSRAASAVRDALERGHAVELHLGPETLELAGARDLERALRALARVVPDPGAPETAPVRGRVRVLAFGTAAADPRPPSHGVGGGAS